MSIFYLLLIISISLNFARTETGSKTKEPGLGGEQLTFESRTGPSVRRSHWDRRSAGPKEAITPSGPQEPPLKTTHNPATFPQSKRHPDISRILFPTYHTRTRRNVLAFFTKRFILRFYFQVVFSVRPCITPYHRIISGDHTCLLGPSFFLGPASLLITWLFDL